MVLQRFCFDSKDKGEFGRENGDYFSSYPLLLLSAFLHLGAALLPALANKAMDICDAVTPRLKLTTGASESPFSLLKTHKASS